MDVRKVVLIVKQWTSNRCEIMFDFFAAKKRKPVCQEIGKQNMDVENKLNGRSWNFIGFPITKGLESSCSVPL